MAYMLLMMEDPAQRDERNEEEGHDAYGQMLDWGKDLQDRGLLVAGESLASTKGAVRLQKRDGKRITMDGPFAEAKEMIGGFFIVSCDTFDEAVEIAATCPAAEWLTVEVRTLGPCFA